MTISTLLAALKATLTPKPHAMSPVQKQIHAVAQAALLKSAHRPAIVQIATGNRALTAKVIPTGVRCLHTRVYCGPCRSTECWHIKKGGLGNRYARSEDPAFAASGPAMSQVAKTAPGAADTWSRTPTPDPMHTATGSTVSRALNNIFATLLASGVGYGLWMYHQPSPAMTAVTARLEIVADGLEKEMTECRVLREKETQRVIGEIFGFLGRLIKGIGKIAFIIGSFYYAHRILNS